MSSAASASERVRAARLRKLARPLTPPERAWLDTYERAHPRARTAPSPAVVDAAPDPSTAPSSTAAPSPSSPAEASFKVLDFSEPAELATVGEHDQGEGGACPIPDCPACRRAQGGMVCTTTGARIWPKMSEDGARGLASSLLGIAALLARFMGKDVTPTKQEIDSLAKAVREAAYRRASWAGAGDDIFALAFVLGAFGMRAMNAPPLRPSSPSSPPSSPPRAP